MRLAPREELAAAARVAPLLRAARDLARWCQGRQGALAAGAMHPAAVAAAAADLELAPGEVEAAWRVAGATGMITWPDGDAAQTAGADVLASGDSDQVLGAWHCALEVMLGAEDLDGLATALYTVGGPVRMEGLFDAYAAAAGTLRTSGDPSTAGHDEAAALSWALEALADLGVVELGTDEAGAG